MFFSKMHTLNPKLIKFFKPRANNCRAKGLVSNILVELEQMREEAMEEEIFLKERQVVHLGMRKLCIKMVGLGLHNSALIIDAMLFR